MWAAQPTYSRPAFAGSGQQTTSDITYMIHLALFWEIPHLVQLTVASRPSINLHNLTLPHLHLPCLFSGSLSLFLINCFLSSPSSIDSCCGDFRIHAPLTREEEPSLYPITSCTSPRFYQYYEVLYPSFFSAPGPFETTYTHTRTQAITSSLIAVSTYTASTSRRLDNRKRSTV
jgi:hypothetical protein